MTKKAFTQSTIIIIIIFVVALFILGFVQRKTSTKDAIKISCQEPKIIGYSLARSPPFCIGCLPTCTANVTVYIHEYTDPVCSGRGGVFASNIVTVPCKGLGDYLGRTVIVQYTIHQENSTVNKVEDVTLEKK